MKTIKKENYQLDYFQQGDITKPAIMVLGSAVYYPRLFSNPLYQDLHLIFNTHVGFTDATKETSRHMLKNVVEDIEATRQALGIETLYLLGHSGHGFMAMAYAETYPEHVLGVILSNLAPTNKKIRQDQSIVYFEKKADQERKNYFYQEIAKLESDIQQAPDKRFSSMNIRMQAHSFYDFTFDGAYLWKDVPNNMPALDHLWGEAFAEYDTEKFFKNTDIEVILLLSDYDYLVAPTTLWDNISETYQIPIIKFEKSGHNPMLEEAEKYHQVLKKFTQS